MYTWCMSYRMAHAEGVLYGTELGSVTLKRVSLFRFPIKHSTHTGTRLGDLEESCQCFILFFN
jgi:hypothetical protein